MFEVIKDKRRITISRKEDLLYGCDFVYTMNLYVLLEEYEGGCSYDVKTIYSTEALLDFFIYYGHAFPRWTHFKKDIENEFNKDLNLNKKRSI